MRLEIEKDVSIKDNQTIVWIVYVDDDAEAELKDEPSAYAYAAQRMKELAELLALEVS